MKTSKQSIFLIYFFLFLLFATNTYSLGIVPAQKEIILDDTSYTYTLRIINTDGQSKNIEINVEGDMNNYVTLSETIFFLKPNEHKDIQVTFNVPSLSSISGGEHVVRIIAKEVSNKDNSLIAKVGVASKLIIYKPEGGTILVPKVYASNFIKNQKNTFLVEIKNKGLKDAKNIVTLLDVYTSGNVKVWSTTSKTIDVGALKTEKVEFSWIPQLENGNYFVRASILFKDSIQTATDTFTIGSPQINIDSVTADDFSIHKINALNIFLSSEWGEPINNIKTKVELANSEKILFGIKAAPVNIDSLGKALVTTYLDATKLEPGVYKILITLEYLGKSQLDVFETQITENNINILSATGNVVSKRGEVAASVNNSPNNSNTIISIILLVVFLNISLTIYLIKSKKKKQ